MFKGEIFFVLNIAFGFCERKLGFFKEEQVITSEPPSLPFNEFPSLENLQKAFRIKPVMFMNREPLNNPKCLE